MSWWGRFLHRLKGPKEEDLERELRSHLELEAEEQREIGVAPEEAHYAARRAFGNTALTMEDTRAVWGWTTLEQIGQDLRYARRTMWKNPGFTAVAILSLALGIGANTAIFTLINVLLMRPVPGVAEPEKLVRLTNASHSYPKFEALKARRIFASTLAFTSKRFPVDVNGTVQWAEVALASGDYFATLGVNPILGRVLALEDEHLEAPVAVLSHGFWTRAFSNDPEVLGKTVRMNGLPVTIIGVTPPDFAGIVVGAPTDITVPITSTPMLWTKRGHDILTRRSAHWIDVLAKLAPGQSLEPAKSQFQTVWPQVLAETAPPDTPRDSSFFRRRTELQPAGNGFSPLRRTFATPLYILMSMVGLVLLIACANVANLLLAKGSIRQHEFAIRLATGAGRWRLIRQLLTENLLLALASTLAGAVLAYWATRGLVGFISLTQGPVILDLAPDWRVLLFAVGATALTTLLCGLAPALWAVGQDAAPALKEHGRSVGGSSAWLRNGFVVSQVALSTLLAVNAGLFLNSLRRALAVDSGMDTTNVLMVRADATSVGHRGPEAVRFFTEFLDRVNSVPGVRSAAMSWAPPVSRGMGNSGDVSIEGRTHGSGEDREVWSNFVSPRYFETVGQTLLAGRQFTERDRRGAPRVTIINQTMARYFFGNESPLGRRIAPWGGSDPNVKRDCEIIGVVRDATHLSLKDEPKRVLYVPYTQGPDFLERENMVLLVRSVGSPAAIATQIRQAAAELDRNVLVETETLRSHVDGSLARERLLAMLSGFLGVLSMVLVAIGLYGVMAYSVARRSGEIGIRLALGARPASVLSMILREGAALALGGVALGILAAVASSRLIAAMLFGITPTDTTAFAGAVVAMVLAALLATMLPARRASRVDPMSALRYE
jgi:predicted permease